MQKALPSLSNVSRWAARATSSVLPEGLGSMHLRAVALFWSPGLKRKLELGRSSPRTPLSVVFLPFTMRGALKMRRTAHLGGLPPSATASKPIDSPVGVLQPVAGLYGVKTHLHVPSPKDITRAGYDDETAPGGQPPRKYPAMRVLNHRTWLESTVVGSSLGMIPLLNTPG